MAALNFHHLHYFWVVANEGSVSSAARRLQVAQPTVSAQLRQLENQVGQILFERVGRGMELTDAGRLVRSYADEIFGLGLEMMTALSGPSSLRPERLAVGAVDAMPKLVIWRLLQPALAALPQLRLACEQNKPERLQAELQMHNLDLVLSDAPLRATTRVRTYSHLLGESAVSFFAVGRTAQRLRRDFPQSLDGEAFLMPGVDSNLRRLLEAWFAEVGIQPIIVGEFEDPGLLKVFAQGGAGVFAAPSVVEDDVIKHYNVRLIAQVDALRERFYAVSAERKIAHPAVIAIRAAAQEDLFVGAGEPGAGESGSVEPE